VLAVIFSKFANSKIKTLYQEEPLEKEQKNLGVKISLGANITCLIDHY
jgi:hypothetical protein